MRTSLTTRSFQVFPIRRQLVKKRLHVTSKVRLNRYLTLYARFALRLAGSTSPASKLPASFEQSLPASSRRKKNPTKHGTQTYGSRSNRSCARRALRTQPRVMEFGGTILLRKSHGIHTQARGKRLLTEAFPIPPIPLARVANGSC